MGMILREMLTLLCSFGGGWDVVVADNLKIGGGRDVAVADYLEFEGDTSGVVGCYAS